MDNMALLGADFMINLTFSQVVDNHGVINIDAEDVGNPQLVSLVLLLLLTSYSGHELCQRDLQLLTHHGKGTGCEGGLPRWTDGDESFGQYS